ncbi:MAG: glycosyltransferase family 4 protein [Planctomycetes bacterium]|nr:glycosyltransferase family 4 protein [Planctomycetota bacterium]
MRIAHLLPGTGSFHCGTCLRDRALQLALRARGHTVTVVPLYLPSFPPEPGDGPVQMGALNLYLQHRLRLWRWLPRWLRDRLDSPRLLRRLSRSGGNTDPAHLGAMTVAMLRGEAGPFGPEIERLVAWFAGEPRYDVIALSNVLLAGLVRGLRRTGAAIVCTLQGEAPFLDALPEPHRGQAWHELGERCREIDAFVAVSRHYRDAVAPRLCLPAERVHVVHNGLPEAATAAPASATEASGPPALGFLARLCEQKGLPLLLDAFLLLRQAGAHPGLRLRVAGVLRGEDRPLLSRLQQRVRDAGLAAFVDWLPDLPDAQKDAFLRSLAVFCVPADAGESFGLFVLEAMAAGVPVVAPDHAAFPELLAHGGGALCAPGDARALAAAIADLLREPARARQLGEQGRLAVRHPFTATRMAAAVEAVYASVAQGRRTP